MNQKIVIRTEHDNSFCADPVGQTGSPLVGRGDTPFDALVDLLKCNEEIGGIEVVMAELEIDDYDEFTEDRDLPVEEVRASGDYDDLLDFLEVANIEAKLEAKGTTWRFRENGIIDYLYEYHSEGTQKTHGNGRGMNLIHDEALEKCYTTRDFMELYMAIGYSLCGFEEVFGEFINKVLRVAYDGDGNFIHRLGPTEETIKLIDEPSVRRC